MLYSGAAAAAVTVGLQWPGGKTQCPRLPCWARVPISADAFWSLSFDKPAGVALR
jgi:hypothetical protein